ncbi:hypothetical protein [Marinicella rhabdoformis]|uniref:hypothetical protein n=1 Tax=Marinicella rhabdoformis TaxID=2580566 RepID=UPI0012AEBBD3|nr:hypothetical protein [Marinicella rhabdoformis]
MRVTVFLLLSTLFFNATANQNTTCDSQLLVSSWKNNNVKIYDGCDYRFIKDLDTKGTLKGPQAIFQDHNGDVIVISEGNHQIVKYDGKTLKEINIVIPAGHIENPISAVLEGEFHVLIHSYAENSIYRYDMRDWQRTDTLLAKGNKHIKGIDLGPNFGPEGMLYVPGYDSNNIIKIDPKTKHVSEFISADLGINRPRTILWRGNKAYVSGWGNANIFELNIQGQITRIMFPTVTGASALLLDGTDHMLISSDRKNSIYRYGFKDGKAEVLIQEDKEHLDASTYVYRLINH